MATRRTPGSRPGLIRCDHCGEEYSASYRRCPFCDEYDEYDAYETTAPRRGGGKRLAKSNRRGGGYGRTSPLRVIGYLISLAVIVAAIYIVVTVISPLIQRGDVPDDVIDDPGPSQSTPVQDADPDDTDAPDVTDEPDSTDEPDDTDTQPEPTPDTSPTGSAANGFTLSKKEFSFTADYPDPVTLTVTFIPTGTSGTITWSSSNTDYVTVDQNGKVSRGTQRGTATVTATLDNGVTQSCTVHNQVGGSASSGGETTPGTASAKLSKTDFTFYTAGEKTTLTVSNYSGSVTWSSSNTSVATVSADGVCKAVGSGRCTITATLSDGTKLEAIARCSLS